MAYWEANSSVKIRPLGCLESELIQIMHELRQHEAMETGDVSIYLDGTAMWIADAVTDLNCAMRARVEGASHV